MVSVMTRQKARLAEAKPGQVVQPMSRPGRSSKELRPRRWQANVVATKLFARLRAGAQSFDTSFAKRISATWCFASEGCFSSALIDRTAAAANSTCSGVAEGQCATASAAANISDRLPVALTARTFSWEIDIRRLSALEEEQDGLLQLALVESVPRQTGDEIGEPRAFLLATILRNGVPQLMQCPSLA